MGVALKLFIKSSSASSNLETTREMSLHIFCDPKTASRASEIYCVRLKGRVLPEEHRIALETVMEYAQTQREDLEVLDVSSIVGSLRGLMCGVVKTPTLIAGGTSFKGLAEISRKIRGAE